jgi:hypothetical protein
MAVKTLRVDKFGKGKWMDKARRTFIGMVCCLSALVLSACSRLLSGPAPIEVVFDMPAEEIEGGVRLAPRESQWDGYGEAIDVRGDVLVIGASEWNYYGPGLAYVYRFSDGEWQEDAQLAASDRDVYIKQVRGFEGQRFGSSVALGDGIIAIGAPGNTYPIAGEYTGAVYLFEYEGQTWVETAKLAPDRLDPDTAQTQVDWLRYDRMRRRSFGALVALNGDTLAVGGDAGDAVYIYQRGESGWHEQARIPVPVSPGRDLYMASLALFGDTLALSAFYVPPQPEQAPVLTGNVTVYVFERDGDAWKESFRFIPEGGEGDFLFLHESLNVGASVALGGESTRANLLAIGLPGFPDWSGVQDHIGMFGVSPEEIPEFPESNRKTGTVYIFERVEDGGWNQRVNLKPAGWENPPGPGSLFSGVPPATSDEQGEFDEAAYYASVVFPGHLFSEEPEISFFGATVDLDGKQLAVTAGFANATYVFERRDRDWVYRFSIIPGREGEGLWEDSAQVVRISGDALLLGTPGEFGNSAYVFRLGPETER